MSTLLETAGGRLVGLRRRGISVYLGIPYAASIEGTARFNFPQPAEPWQGVRNATLPGAPAPQNPSIRPFAAHCFGLAQDSPSENCLSLNIYTPECDSGRRPVMVWIHGGAFVYGSGGVPLYAGDSLARAGNVVVVNLNYRLGALGFLDIHEFSDRFATNLGLRDQIAALLWIRENIAAFGGDPSNVTLFGESAGAMCAAALLAAPEARSLFNRVILQSGAAHHVSTKQRALRVAETFLDELNLTSRDVSRLIQIPWPIICRAQRRVAWKLHRNDGQLPWQPVIDEDLLPVHPESAVASGVAMDKDLLIGTNSDEWKFFSLRNKALRSLTLSELRIRLQSALSAFPDRESLIDEVFELYDEELNSTPNGSFELWCSFQRDRVFRSPAERLAVAQSHQAGRTYKYLFDWSCPVAPRWLGACHGLDLPFVFGACARPAFVPFIGIFRDARRLSTAIQKAWTSFAWGSSPSTPELGDWTPYETDNPLAMRLSKSPCLRTIPKKESLQFHSRLASREAISDY